MIVSRGSTSQTKTMFTSKGIAHRGGILALPIILIILGIFVSNLSNKHKELIFTTSEPETIINELQKYLNKEDLELVFERIERGGWHIDWTNENGYTVKDLLAPSIGAEFPWGPREYDTKKSAAKQPLVKKLLVIIPKIFLENGFAKSRENSFVTKNDYIERLGFYKEKTACMLTIVYIYKEVFITCSDKIEERHAEQLPYYKRLNLSRDRTIFIYRETEEFAMLLYGDRDEMYPAIAARIDDNDNWKIISVGGLFLSCSVIEKYDVPEELLFPNPIRPDVDRCTMN